MAADVDEAAGRRLGARTAASILTLLGVGHLRGTQTYQPLWSFARYCARVRGWMPLHFSGVHLNQPKPSQVQPLLGMPTASRS
jgi:hypothetical protein